MYKITDYRKISARTKEIIQDDGIVSFLKETNTFLKNKYLYTVDARYRYLQRTFRYPESTPRRYDLISINPRSISHIIVPALHETMPVQKFDTNVVDGEWDKQYSDETLWFQGTLDGFDTVEIIPFSNFEFYTSVVAHFEDGVPWEQTPLYEYFYTQVESKDDDRRYGTPQKIEKQLRHIDELYTDMAESGYLSQKQLAKQPYESPFEHRPSLHPNHHEIVISIGRDGTMFLNDGRHRFTIARILGISEIPVRVLVRHTNWQEIRERIATAEHVSELPPEYRQYTDHPDVGELL